MPRSDSPIDAKFAQQGAAHEAPFAFAQKERDAETDLHYFEARYLGSHRARFLSPDPKYANPAMMDGRELAAFLANPQMANLYAYTINNPLKYQDADGNEIKVSKSVSKGITTYRIDYSAALIDLSSKGYSSDALQKMADEYTATIKSAFTGSEGKVRWETHAKIRVITDLADAGAKEHTIRLLDKPGVGRSIAQKGDSGVAGRARVGGLWAEIYMGQMMKPPSEVPFKNEQERTRYLKGYISPATVAAHEGLGHSGGGLGHVGGENLMSHDSTFDNRQITRTQIEKIYSNYQEPRKLNQPE